MNSRKYHTLATRDNGRWAPQFGSYWLDDVKTERDDYIQSGAYKRNATKIITTRPGQSFIDDAVNAMNQPTK